MFRNVSSQKVAVFAWDNAAGVPKTGLADITAQISIDGGATAATDDTNPTELDATDAPGIYLFDMLQAETDGDLIIVYAVSATSDIVLRPVTIYTQGQVDSASIADAVWDEATAGHVTAGTFGELFADTWTFIKLIFFSVA